MSPTPAKARGTGSPDAREVERRLHCRYPITLDVEYKLLPTGSGEQIGIGKTVNISGVGVLFEATDALPARREVEVLIHWPLLKEGTSPLKLVMYGRVIRSDGKLVAVRVSRHEFRIGAGAR
jgi:hypothetical protein